MTLALTSSTLAIRLGVAALIGLAVGTEREWSGPASGPTRRFAGLRTFLLFGMIGGIAGMLLALEQPLAGSILLATAMGFNVVAYGAAVRRPEQPLSGTTEAAALVVVGLGGLAGLGFLMVAAGAGAVVVFALGEKDRLHWLVSRIGRVEMHAALQFLVLACVVLPLLPTGPYEALWGFRPRTLWIIVLMLSGINFAGYVAQRAVGPGRGYGVTGALAGLLSSTLVTLQFSRISRQEPQHARGLALGVMAACTVLPLRVMVVSAALNPATALQVAFMAVPVLIVGALFSVYLYRDSASVEQPAEQPKNPLRLFSALQMAVVFQLSFLAIGFARTHWGNSGVVGSAAVLGLADLDALTVSMARMAQDSGGAVIAAKAIAIGLLANTMVKLGISLIVGKGAFRRYAASGMTATAMVLVAALWWRW